MYTLNSYEGTVTRNSDGKVIAPCQSYNDPDHLEYIDWVEAGNLPIVVSTSISAEKLKGVERIDKRTQELIGQGAVFNGTRFSLSSDAQGNWTKIKAFADVITSMNAWPFAITTFNDEEYLLADAAEAVSFTLTMNMVVNMHIASGRTLKVQMLALTDVNDVLNFLDPR